jgi:5,10-methylene-tetrahydrofolate dehydrogenase/Methenyl tetrahydrofolate cyclohydrolase
MAKLLIGSELASFVKERQAKQVRNLRQEHKIFPRLAIIVTDPSPVIATYVRLKKRYGEDILVDVDVYQETMDSIAERIVALNNDSRVHAMIVQLPLHDVKRTDEIVRLVEPSKDVDGLGSDQYFTPATALAIQWLLAGYNIDLVGKKILIVGNGRLVGAPLAHLWRNSGLDPKVVDDSVQDLATEIENSDIIVTATGVPGLISGEMLQPSTVVVDAGTASENGKIVGDLADDVYERDDIKVTPAKGGVGPLTVSALFDNVIQAALRKIKQ